MLMKKYQFSLPTKDDQIKLDKNKDSSAKIESATFAISCWTQVSSKIITSEIDNSLTSFMHDPVVDIH